MHRPSIQISDRNTFIEEAKRTSRPVRIGRTWTSVTVQEGDHWRERPAVRFFYELEVANPSGPVRWTYSEVVPLDAEGSVEGTLQSELQSAQVPSEIMHSQSGSL
jgi:hypothetical protein